MSGLHRPMIQKLQKASEDQPLQVLSTVMQKIISYQSQL